MHISIGTLRSLAVFLLLASPLSALAQFNARVQAIHNSPDPELDVIDLYVADQLILDDVPFRTASPYLDVPALITLTGGIAPGNSTGPNDVFFEFSFSLGLNQTYQFILQGVRDPGLFLPNPDGRDISLDVLVNGDAREVASDPGLIEANFVHGSTDVPAVDVMWSSASANDLKHGDVTGYESVPFVDTVVILPLDGSPGGSVWLPPDPKPVPGQAITLLLSGFEDPISNQNGEPFRPFVVFGDGQSIALLPFPVAVEPVGEPVAGLKLHGNHPNPFTTSTTVSFDLESPARVKIELFDELGRRVSLKDAGAFSAGTNHEIQLDAMSLPSGSYLYRVLAEMSGGVRVRRGWMMLIR